MGRLFGTDGIRGVANVDLRPTMAFALGRATARRLAEPGAAIVVGQDTRRSGDMFVAAIVAGATSLGVDVHVVGVVPTPALAFLARTETVRDKIGRMLEIGGSLAVLGFGLWTVVKAAS